MNRPKDSGGGSGGWGCQGSVCGNTTPSTFGPPPHRDSTWVCHSVQVRVASQLTNPG